MILPIGDSSGRWPPSRQNRLGPNFRRAISRVKRILTDRKFITRNEETFLLVLSLQGEFEELKLKLVERVSSWESRHVIGAKTRRMCRVFPRPRNPDGKVNERSKKSGIVFNGIVRT